MWLEQVGGGLENQNGIPLDVRIFSEKKTHQTLEEMCKWEKELVPDVGSISVAVSLTWIIIRTRAPETGLCDPPKNLCRRWLERWAGNNSRAGVPAQKDWGANAVAEDMLRADGAIAPSPPGRSNGSTPGNPPKIRPPLGFQQRTQKVHPGSSFGGGDFVLKRIQGIRTETAISMAI